MNITAPQAQTERLQSADTSAKVSAKLATHCCKQILLCPKNRDQCKGQRTFK